MDKEFKKFNENFSIEKSLGSGSYGSVYLVSGKGQQYAVKFIPYNPDAVERVVSEVQITSKVNSPYIVTYYGLYISDVTLEGKTKRYYLLPMKYIPGVTLDKFIRVLPKINRQEYQRTILLLMKQVFSALRDLHNKGIVHADIKEENVLVDKTAQIHLIDFGLSCTEGNCVNRGTPLYMPWEIHEYYDEDQEVFYKQDIWAAGVMFYRIVAGDYPYDGNNIDDLLNNLRNDIRELPLPDWSTHLNQIIDHALTLEWRDRPDANEMILMIDEELSTFPPLSS